MPVHHGQGATISNNRVTSVVRVSSDARKKLVSQVKQSTERYRSHASRNIKFSILAVLLIGIGASQLVGRASGSTQYVAPQARLDNPLQAPEAQPVDEVVAAEVAANAAQEANLLITSNATNRADTLDAQVKIAAKTEEATTAVVEKPQLVVSNDTSIASIKKITVQKGDTLASLARQYGISADTIRWANNLATDELTPGSKLTILPVSGVLYTVQSGDTVKSLASEYKTTAEQISAFNDLELKSLKPGRQIIIPGGIKPTVAAPSSSTSASSSYSSSASTSFAFGDGGVQFSGNKYAYGYCTYYAFNKRAASGRPVGSNWGNATTWAALARVSGFAVDNNARAGDVFQTSGGWGGYGHVGYVERVNADGSVLVSEMNYAGWNVVSSRTLSASEARSYNFIH